MDLWTIQSKKGDRGVSAVVNDLAPYVRGYRHLDESIEENKGLYDTEFFTGKGKSFTVEVKTDDYAIKNWNNDGRIYIEYEQYGQPSCIVLTEADIWAIVVGDLIYYIRTNSLKILCDMAEIGESTKYDTKGYYIYRRDLETYCINIQDIING